MKKIYFVVALLALFCLIACGGGTTTNSGGNSAATNSNTGSPNSTAQTNSDRGEAALQLDGGEVSVEYGRPALKGRDLEKMISQGQEWRMGSNAPTTLTTDTDLKFGDTLIPKGKYMLKAKSVAPQEWRLLVQTEDQATVAEIPLAFQKVDDSAELMTIDLPKKGNGGSFVLHWGTLTLSTDFQKA